MFQFCRSLWQISLGKLDFSFDGWALWGSKDGLALLLALWGCLLIEGCFFDGFTVIYPKQDYSISQLNSPW
jgi:hypothetical protein